MGLGFMVSDILGASDLRIPAFTTIANLFICIAYWAYERRVPKEWRPPLGKNARQAEGTLTRKLNFNTISKM